MPIDETPRPDRVKAPLPTGWLQVSPQWLASFFGLAPTGEVTVVLGLIRVGVVHASLQPGQVVEGTLTTLVTPTGFRPVA